MKKIILSILIAAAMINFGFSLQQIGGTSSDSFPIVGLSLEA